MHGLQYNCTLQMAWWCDGCVLWSSQPDGTKCRNYSHSNHPGDTWRTRAGVKKGYVNRVLSEALSQSNKVPNYLVNEGCTHCSFHSTEGALQISYSIKDKGLYNAAHNLAQIQVQSIFTHYKTACLLMWAHVASYLMQLAPRKKHSFSVPARS